ncbi:hypothetical protein LX36DRAFT_702935, partial [Colletotrichum falcatum]
MDVWIQYSVPPNRMTCLPRQERTTCRGNLDPTPSTHQTRHTNTVPASLPFPLPSVPGLPLSDTWVVCFTILLICHLSLGSHPPYFAKLPKVRLATDTWMRSEQLPLSDWCFFPTQDRRPRPRPRTARQPARDSFDGETQAPQATRVRVRVRVGCGWVIGGPTLPPLYSYLGADYGRWARGTTAPALLSSCFSSMKYKDMH